MYIERGVYKSAKHGFSTRQLREWKHIDSPVNKKFLDVAVSKEDNSNSILRHHCWIP